MVLRRDGQGELQDPDNSLNFGDLVALGCFCDLNDLHEGGKCKVYKYYEVKLRARYDINALG